MYLSYYTSCTFSLKKIFTSAEKKERSHKVRKSGSEQGRVLLTILLPYNPSGVSSQTDYGCSVCTSEQQQDPW